jgi:hypothetical protein
MTNRNIGKNYRQLLNCTDCKHHVRVFGAIECWYACNIDNTFRQDKGKYTGNWREDHEIDPCSICDDFKEQE